MSQAELVLMSAFFSPVFPKYVEKFYLKRVFCPQISLGNAQLNKTTVYLNQRVASQLV